MAKERTAFLVVGLTAVLALLTATASFAERENETHVPPPRKPRVSTSGNMKIAFASVPLNCRLEVQRQLRAYGFYAGAIDGRWGLEVAEAIVRYTGNVQSLAYGWPTLAGSKGILWHIGFLEVACPMPPYAS